MLKWKDGAHEKVKGREGRGHAAGGIPALEGSAKLVQSFTPLQLLLVTYELILEVAEEGHAILLLHEGQQVERLLQVERRRRLRDV